jgi:hypothetical protein
MKTTYKDILTQIVCLKKGDMFTQWNNYMGEKKNKKKNLHLS